jgi:hypothetical protein
MFVKITIAIAFILGTASGALAAPKQKQHTNRAHVHDTHGQHGGSASRVKTTHAKTAHAKTARAKTTHAKTAQKRRTIETYASYESRNWTFGSATSALAMVNPKQTCRALLRARSIHRARIACCGNAKAETQQQPCLRCLRHPRLVYRLGPRRNHPFHDGDGSSVCGLTVAAVDVTSCVEPASDAA